MLVMGVDPGTARTGYGLVRPAGGRLQAIAHGTIETSSKLPPAERLAVIHRRLAGLVEQHRPAVVAVEEVFFGANARSAMAVGQARGAALLAAVLGGAAVAEYTPFQVKQAVTGYGRADKGQVRFMVKSLLGLKEIPFHDDVTDALATAICCLHRWRGEAWA